jgi:anti-anti-sigma factor
MCLLNRVVEVMNLDMQVDGELGVIRVRGELDGVDAPRLHDAADLMLDDGVRDLVIDCDGVTFIDSGGLQVIVSAHTRAEAKGGTLTLRRPSALARQVFELTGLDAILRIDGASPSERASE